MKLAQRHRTEVVVPRLQPTVKWPHGAAAAGRLGGSRHGRRAVAERRGVSRTRSRWVSGRCRRSISSIASTASRSCSTGRRRRRISISSDWLARVAGRARARGAGPRGTAQALQMSADAAQILAAHPNVPRHACRWRTTSSSSRARTTRTSSTRDRRTACSQRARASSSPRRCRPGRPRCRGRSTGCAPTCPGLVPYVGAGGDERDVRVWAWLAFLRARGTHPVGLAAAAHEHADRAGRPERAHLVLSRRAGSASTSRADDPAQVAPPAQQDYEYLWLAKQRGEGDQRAADGAADHQAGRDPAGPDRPTRPTR